MAKPPSGSTLDTGNALYTGMLHIWAMLENTGTTTADSRNGNTGTLNASVTWSTDASGDVCLAFSDHTVTQPIAITQFAVDDGSTKDWTIAWRAAQTTSNDNGMACGKPSGTDNYIWMRGGNYLRYLDVAINNNFTGVTSFTTQADYVLSNDFTTGVSNDMSLYKDGSLVSTWSQGTAPALLVDTIGNGFANLGLEGKMSYFYVWRGRALTSGEAATLAANPYAIFVTSQRLILIPN